MQAITTKYLGPTNTRGSRIKASCPAGSITVPYDYGERYGGHRSAAIALMKKLGWDEYGTWYEGDTETGHVYVCSPDHAPQSVQVA